MARKGHTQKRDVLADPLYNNKVVTKLINNIMPVSYTHLVDVLVVLKDAEFEIFLHVLVSLSKSAAGAAEVFSYIIYQNDSTL